MIEKRFEVMDGTPLGTHTNIWDRQKQHNQGVGDELWLGEVIGMLNEGVMIAKENEQLKQQIKKLEAQLYKVEDGVCDICNNMYLVQQGRYFVSKCKKGHDECSKMDLDYCDDFELKGDVE